MGLYVPKTNLVVVNSCPPSAWEFSQQVLFETCYFYQFLAISTPMNPACHCSLIKWPLLFTDDQSFTFDVHYISLTYTALTGAISLTQTIRSVRQGTSPQYQKCYLNLVIWYWYRYLSAQPIISNSEAAMLSKIKGRHFQNILSNSVNLEGPLLEPARSRQIK